MEAPFYPVTAYVLLGAFVASLALSTWQVMRRGAPRLYWRIACGLSWVALAGYIAFDRMPVTMDAEGFVHEEFWLIGISSMLAVVACALNLGGALWLLLRSIRRKAGA